MSHTIVRGGLVLDIAAGIAEPGDILIEGDTIREIGPPGCIAPDGAIEISAAQRLLHPGLVNAHTHGHGNLGKGMGDCWTLELLLAAAPWITGNRDAEDKYLSTQLGAVEMVLKGCTACYDLSFEWPVPTSEGLAQAAQAYADVGMRAVVAPMVADRSFNEAIGRRAEHCRRRCTRRQLVVAYRSSTLSDPRGLTDWSFDRDQVRPAVAPTIPHHCSDAFISGCASLAQEFDIGLHSHVAESKVQATTVCGSTATPRPRIGGARRHGPQSTVAHGGVGLTMTTWRGSAIKAPRSLTTPAATCGSAAGSPMRGRCSSGGSISGSALMGPIAPITRICTRRCKRRADEIRHLGDHRCSAISLGTRGERGGFASGFRGIPAKEADCIRPTSTVGRRGPHQDEPVRGEFCLSDGGGCRRALLRVDGIRQVTVHLGRRG